LVAAAVAAVVAALVFVPADFTIEAPGTLEPAVRQDVFAPRNGLVDEVLVEHGADVVAGQPLVKLRDPELELDLRRVRGEMETVRRQLDAVRAAKTGREIRDASPTDLYRLSASEREFAQRLENLQRELALLTAQRDSLVVRSPIAGRVLTWDTAGRLAARPVERGEALATVADLSADWELELNVADDRIGHVLAARDTTGADLPVEFRLRSLDQSHTGHIQTISRTAEVGANEAAAAPTVRVIVAFDKSQLSDAAQRELRPGVSATAQIDCGRRSLGYVWFHDAWDAAIGWLRF
jgi:multidrug efflux pump subunit AcrA (membrane-fusion protein)